MKKTLKLFVSSILIAITFAVPQITQCMEEDTSKRLDRSSFASSFFQADTESFNDKRPQEHFCPITLEVMNDPVVAADGHSYEKEAIESHFKATPHPNSPMTGLPLSNQNLVNNRTLKTMILDWKPENQSGASALEGRNAVDMAQCLLLAEQTIESLTKELAELQGEKRAEKEKEIKKDRLRELRLSALLVARRYEQISRRFLNGKLIYKPNQNNDMGKIELRIADLNDPLDGTFDLSQCGDAGTYLSISTGYRKEKKRENSGKIEIWFTPRFLVEKEINGSASHFKEIFTDNWPEEADIGIIWAHGEVDLDWYDYLTKRAMHELECSSIKQMLCCANSTNTKYSLVQYRRDWPYRTKRLHFISEEFFLSFYELS